jgi:hypothetical protein
MSTQDEAVDLWRELVGARFSCELCASVVGSGVDGNPKETYFSVAVTAPSLTAERLMAITAIASKHGCEVNMTVAGRLALAPVPERRGAKR